MMQTGEILPDDTAAAHTFDLFVIHAIADADFVRCYLLPSLDLPKSQVLNIDDLTPGALAVAEIERGVSSSKFTVVVLSPAWLADRWAVFGGQLASYLSIHDVRIVPLRLRDCDLPLHLKARVSLDFTEPVLWESEIARLRALLRATPPTAKTIHCPYPGMRPFSEIDAPEFFGRDQEIDELIGRLDRGERDIYVIGPSGSGKSSLVQAGLLHLLSIGSSRLERSFICRTMRPGERPTDRLVKALGGDLATPAATLAALVGRHPPATRVLVFVDQLEELFTLSDTDERQRFVTTLRALRAETQCYLLLALRADFYGGLMDSALWPECGGILRLDVAPLRGAALVQAITAPAVRAGIYLDPRLCDRIVADAAEEPGALPLVQETLRMLWDRRCGRLIGLHAYEALGGSACGLDVAIARCADTAVSSLTSAQRNTALRVLLRLVNLGENHVDTRRQQDIASLRSSVNEDAEFDTVLQRLVAARLVTVDGETMVGDALADLSHEALITAWPMFRDWITRCRADEQRRRWFESKATEWCERGRGVACLLDAVELVEVEQWLQSDAVRELGCGTELSALVRASKRELRKMKWQRGQRTLLAALLLFIPVLLLFIASTRPRGLGTVDLTIIPFDWAPGTDVRPIPCGIAAIPGLSLSLYASVPDDLEEHGELIPEPYVEFSPPMDLGLLRDQRLRGPGGTVFLKIDSRGRADEHCAPSWIRIQSFPGYRTDDIKSVVLWVPTCRATFADTVTIENGPFIYGGAGEPASKHFGETDYTEPEQVIDLPAFAIDRTEVSNAAFAPFGWLGRVSGYLAPVYAAYGTDNEHPRDGDPTYPVSNVDAFEAKAYCEYMGKQLPSDFQWTKAARGGLTIDGKPNPHPRRLYPWGTVENLQCVNLHNDKDGYPWTSPVNAFPCGASPYGVLNLAGNVQEWIARDGQTDRVNPLHVLRGGFPDALPGLDVTTTILRNHRAPRALYYSNGLRCVVQGVEPASGYRPIGPRSETREPPQARQR